MTGEAVGGQVGGCVVDLAGGVLVVGGGLFDDLGGVGDALLAGLEQRCLALGCVGEAGQSGLVLLPSGCDGVEAGSCVLADLISCCHDVADGLVDGVDLGAVSVESAGGRGGAGAGIALPAGRMPVGELPGVGAGCGHGGHRGRAQELARLFKKGVDWVHTSKYRLSCRL